MEQQHYKTRCPGCHRLLADMQPLTTCFDLSYNPSMTADFYSAKHNLAYCDVCQMPFRHELPLLIFHSVRQYAVYVCAQVRTYDKMQGKARLFSLFGYQDFRFRIVRFYIEAVEKARIFDDSWDDRAIELMKRDFCPTDIAERKGDYLLLYDGMTDDALSFCVYDDFDRPTDDRFTVPAHEYERYRPILQPEPLDKPLMHWRLIDADWAQQQSF